MITLSGKSKTFASTFIFGGLVLGSSLLLNGCQCKNPNGCKPTLTPRVDLALDNPAGTYAAPIDVVLSSENAINIYYSTNGVLPSPADCDPYLGESISIVDNVTLGTLAQGDGVNYLDSAAFFTYVIKDPLYKNRLRLQEWMALEGQIKQRFYCEFNECNQPPTADLANPINWAIACDTGYATYVNDPSVYTSQFHFEACQIDDAVVTGDLTLVLDAEKLPAIAVNTNGLINIETADYTTTVSDHTLRSFTVVTGTERPRWGYYDVTCSGSGCFSGPMKIKHGVNSTLQVADPAIAVSCPN
jgi:hypothetical protein